MPSPHDINPAGFTIHSAIHAAREDAQCVLHTHSLNGVAVSAQRGGVLPISQQSIFVLSSLGYHAYEGVALRDDEKPRLVADLGDRGFLMLRNHGLLTVGGSVEAAAWWFISMDNSAHAQLLAQAAGPLKPIAPDVARLTASQVGTDLGGYFSFQPLYDWITAAEPDLLA